MELYKGPARNEQPRNKKLELVVGAIFAAVAWGATFYMLCINVGS